MEPQFKSYLRVMGFADLFRTTISILFRNFLTLGCIFGIIAFPVFLLQEIGVLGNSSWIFWALLPVPYYAIVALVGEVSVVIFGSSPSVRRAFGRVQGLIWLKLFATQVIAYIPFWLSIPLSVVLGILFGVMFSGVAGVAIAAFIVLAGMYFTFIRFLFVTQIVALEKVYFLKALKRAWSFSKGRTGRIFGYMLMLLIFFVLLSLAVLAPIPDLEPEQMLSSGFPWLLYLNALAVIFAVVAFTFLTALYYSLRVERFEITTDNILLEATR